MMVPLQIEALKKLHSLPLFVQLRHVLDGDTWCQAVDGVTYVSAMLSPVCSPLESSNSPRDFYQAGLDVAECIGAMTDQRVQHRDISPNNFGMYDGRGWLYDWSSSKVGCLKYQGGLVVIGTSRYSEATNALGAAPQF